MFTLIPETSAMTTPQVLYIKAIASVQVPDAVDRTLSNFIRASGNEAGASEAKPYMLKFKDELPDTFYTASKIKAKDGKLVEIALCDSRSGSIVSEGPLSSVEIKICVFNSDLMVGSNRGGPRIMCQRDNKGHLLKGDTVIKLRKGVGYFSNIKFTDNSHWTRSGRFRLGAMLQSPSNQAITKEAVSETFVVREGRLEGNQKHYPPSPKDPIWRLKNIAKDKIIHRRLSNLEINTVEDLLLIYETNPSLLHENGRISAKLNEAIRHAKTCNREVTITQDLINSDEKKRLERGKQHRLPYEGTSANCFPIPSPAYINPIEGQPGKIQDFGQSSTSSTTPLIGTEVAYIIDEDFLLHGSNAPTEFPVFDSENDFAFYPMGMRDKNN